MLVLSLFLLLACQAVTVEGAPQTTTPPGMLPPPIGGIGYRHHTHCGPGCPGQPVRH